MPKQLFLLIAMMSLIAGCQSTPVPIDTACAWVKPISTNKADRKLIPRDVKEQIAAHNELVDRKCPNE